MKKARIYGDPSCPACGLAKRYLKHRGVDVEERHYSELKDPPCRAIPIIEIKGRKLCGFRPNEVEELLR